MRKRALRAHHIFDVKRSGEPKNRVVVNGKRQDNSTYSDTASPVASLLQVRIFIAVMTARNYFVMQGDYKNAYLTADLKDFVLIVIPEGFPHAGDIAILRKAQYGTKQGARRFYDKAADDLIDIGMVQCPTEPCLFRYTTPTSTCFLLLYVDDSLIAGDENAVRFIMQQLEKNTSAIFTIPRTSWDWISHNQPTNTLQQSACTHSQQKWQKDFNYLAENSLFGRLDEPTFVSPGSISNLRHKMTNTEAKWDR